MEQQVQEVLNGCTIDGNIVRLPAEQLDRKLYLKVADALKFVGGKWTSGKVQGFVFTPGVDIELLLGRAREGGNMKKETQFFATPKEIATKMVIAAEVRKGMDICEPSAGRGAIVEVILDLHKEAHVTVIELSDVNMQFLEKLKGIESYVLGDFLKHDEAKKYDRIIANPPFSKNQDIDHIRKMYDLLKEGGRLVSIAGTHWTFAQEKKCEDFRDWLKFVDAEIEDLPAGTFRESGTNTATCMVTISK